MATILGGKMAHSNYTLTDRLVWNRKDKSFLLIQKAHWKNVKLDIVKRDIHHQKPELRNLIKYILSPWLFIAPQDKRGFWGDSEYGIDNWWNNEQKDKYRISCTLYGKREQSINKIKSLIEKHEPEFIYTFNAYLKNKNNNLYTLFGIYAIYRMWKTYKHETEMLVKLGYNKLATQKSIYKLSTPKKQAIIKCLLKDHPYGSSATITDIQEYMLGVENSYLFRQCKRSYGLYQYMLKQPFVDLYRYNDYKRMLKELNIKERLKDKYWLYPKDLNEAHNRVMVELENKKNADLVKKNANYNIDLHTIPKCEATIGGFSLYLANDIEDIINQASVLFQCLITCRYYEKVAQKKSLLIFMKQDNKPIGTCEIGYNKEIKQCYGDERNRYNCKLTNEQMAIMNSYIAKLKINNITKEIKYAY